jgi:hypothetical protein
MSQVDQTRMNEHGQITRATSIDRTGDLGTLVRRDLMPLQDHDPDRRRDGRATIRSPG